MKDELQGFDPFPPKERWEAEGVDWSEKYLEMKGRFKNRIRPAKIPETARALGQRLRRAREVLSISVAQAAKGTFLQARFIDAIECGELELLPGGLYTRRFIERYARFLNFDLWDVHSAFLSGNATVEVLKDSFSIGMSYAPRKVSAKSDEATKLPRFGELLLYFFLPNEERESFLGDVEQKYVAIEAKFGIRAAKVFFYKEILDSMSPLLARFIARIIVGILEEIK
jgi:transcriptional regulator with XRE-family HTH domain